MKVLAGLVILIIVITYPYFMIMGFIKGSLTIWTGILMTVFSGSAVGFIYWSSKIPNPFDQS
jgi:hypothetical protein